ncbi:FxSxx-COOH system tetratricopeptide repeat protein [Streptomyces sp. NPDC026673]|uniref:FxSxx-COOH system tetratricopeptide repeat protein n=1 Tax=Streptomyces sp. NPDC026673 TaxID=3155724 RepID=UPI0034031E6B
MPRPTRRPDHRDGPPSKPMVPNPRLGRGTSRRRTVTGGREGRIITFYSYKGGVGRTMAVANIAWILASNGHRVLACDWDLEAPGLHHYFHPFLPPAALGSTTGIVDLFADHAVLARGRGPRGRDLYTHTARVRPHALSVEWAFPGGGSLDFLSAGRQNAEYLDTLASLSWDYVGGPFLSALREDMQRNYDYVLIDSRTGLSNAVEICTVDLPDVLVSCFTLNIQSIEGAARTARYIGHNSPGWEIRILPVPMRVGGPDTSKLAAGRQRARNSFEGLPSGLSGAAADRYWAEVAIPDQPKYGCEEILAVFGDVSGEPGSLLTAYERLTSAITDGLVERLPVLDESLRRRHLASFTLPVPTRAVPVVLAHVPADRLWAEWIGWALRSAGFQVLPPDSGAPSGTPAVVAVSPNFLGSPRSRTMPAAADGSGGTPGGVARVVPVMVEPVVLPTRLAGLVPVDLTGLDEAGAAAAVLQALDQPGSLDGVLDPARPRFPARQPVVWRVPGRDTAFVGRDLVLDRLHDSLAVSRSVVVLPDGGLPGAGRRWLAVEYAHRFRADYNLVWWIPAGTAHAATASLARLAEALWPGTLLDGADAACARVVEALTAGRPYDRWLLVFDDAGGPGELAGLVPSGAGRVLITSRSASWAESIETVQLGAFSREESVELLRGRVSGLGEPDADRVASAVGDMPLAVAQAATWLRETETSAVTYVRELARAGAESASPVTACCRVALAGLREVSPAAVRLLWLCSQLAPTPLPLDALVRSETLAGVLWAGRVDRADPLRFMPVLQEAGRSGLLEVDRRAQTLRMHRAVQLEIHAEVDSDERDAVRHHAHLILAEAVRNQPDGVLGDEAPEGLQALWPHLDHTEAEHCSSPEVKSALMRRASGSAPGGAAG